MLYNCIFVNHVKIVASFNFTLKIKKYVFEKRMISLTELTHPRSAASKNREIQTVTFTAEIYRLTFHRQASVITPIRITK